MEINGNNGVCPSCYQAIPDERRADPVIVCAHCGWTHSGNELKLEKKAQRKLTGIVMLGSLLLVGAFIHIVNWNEHALTIIPLKTQQILGGADRGDFMQMAEICREEGKPECVENSYKEIIKRNPSDLKALAHLGKVQVNRKRMPEAVVTLTSYFDQGGVDLETGYYYAKALAATGQVKEAEKYYQMVLKARPDVLQVTVAEHYVQLLVQNQELERAKNFINDVREKGSNTKYFMQTELRKIEESMNPSPTPN